MNTSTAIVKPVTRRYVVSYELPYKHRVEVGIEAESEAAARALAKQRFDNGTFWDDTEESPLLHDNYEEDDQGNVLEFVVERMLPEGEPWPQRDPCVRNYRAGLAALEAARSLVKSYRRGEENGGSVSWEDVDAAYEAALRALAEYGG